MAKGILSSFGVTPEEVDISADTSKFEEMYKRTDGARTVPQIFIGEHYVGGYEQLSVINRQGRLQAVLEGAKP